MAEVRIGPESGLPLARGNRPLMVEYGGRRVTVDMPGWYRDGSDEAMHDRDDMRVSDRALVTLKAEVLNLAGPDQVREIRMQLGLSQAEAGRILGGGPRAFQKYESGEVATSRSMTNLLRTVQRHPGELDRMRAEAEAGAGEALPARAYA